MISHDFSEIVSSNIKVLLKLFTSWWNQRRRLSDFSSNLLI